MVAQSQQRLQRRQTVAQAVTLALTCTVPYLLAGAAYAEAAPQAKAPTTQSTAKDEIIDYVIVTGSQVELPPDFAGGQVAKGGRVGLFGNLDLMDTPFNSTNFTAEFMRNLQARSVADVVQSDPGVRVARGFGNFQELYVVRGFPVYSDDMSYNGLYGLLPRQYVAAEFLERVEVFRGANSFLNGAAPGGSGVGGSFNLVPKRAPDRALNRVTLGYENSGQGYLAADFARRFGEGERFGMRANAVRRDGETSVDNQDRELSVLSLGVDYRGEKARFSADLGWQDHLLEAPRPNVTPSTGIPRAPDASKNFAQNWSYSGEKDLFGVARGEYDLSDTTSLWAAVGVRDSEEHNVLSNPTATAEGATSAYKFENYREDLITTGEVGLRTQFDTGAVSHRVSIQGAIFDLDSKNAYSFSSFAGFSSDLYRPVQVVEPTDIALAGGVMFSPRTTTRTKTRSVALADTLGFADDRLLVTVGARYQELEQHTYNYNTGAENCQTTVDLRRVCGFNDDTITPVAGVVVKPSDKISVYANYIEGLVPGSLVPQTIATANGPVQPTNAGTFLDPFKSKQYEIGAKYDSGNFGATLAVFRINRPSSILVGGTVRADGEQRNQGVELSWYGQPLDGLRVLGGINFLDATYQKTQFGSTDGKDVIGVPELQTNIGVEWDVPGLQGLSVDGRWVYTGAQAANATNTWEIPSWNRLDLGARYGFSLGSTEVTVRARIDNVTDRDYWSSVGGEPGSSYLVLASPRTFVLSASVDF